MRTLAAALLALVVCGCSSPQPVVPDVRRECLTWTHDIQPITSSKCDGCHSGSDPAGGVRTDSYFGAIGAARAGDSTSPLVTALDPNTSNATHRALSATSFAPIQKWVVQCDVAYTPSQVHDPGNLNPASVQFHGKLVTDNSVDLCKTCHASDLTGGKTGVSCQSCHKQGADSCTTCHGNPPMSGAHLAHVGGDHLDCIECHTKPKDWPETAHLHGGPANVVFTGGRAGTAGKYDATAKSCSGVACHGAGVADTAATNQTPKWTGGADQAACGTCHGLPPSGHMNTGNQCSQCHALVIDAQNHFVDPAKHDDGKVELGVENGTGCASCHGQPPATGAHLAHVTATHKLRGPIDCAECHKVPQNVTDAGHIDQNVQVFPAGSGALASKDSASPAWSADAMTCSGVYCHGGGMFLRLDVSPDVNRTPGWLAGSSAAACGSCHGIPPMDNIHPQNVPFSACTTCHPKTMDASGAIVVNPDGSSTHMNGVIDVSIQ